MSPPLFFSSSQTSFAEELWNFFAVDADDSDLYVSEDEDVIEGVSRKDGKAMTEDDEAALLPYGGFVSLVTFLSDIDAVVGELDAPVTGEADEAAAGGDECGAFGDAVVSRKDGKAMTEEDERALLEYGGLTMMFSILSTTPLVGDIEASVTGEAAFGPHASPFASRCRKAGGEELDSDDEAALLEFAPLFYLNLAAEAVLGERPDEAHGCGLFPAADEGLAEYGAAWGASVAQARSQWELERSDGAALTEEDAEGLLHYGAWAHAGALLLGLWKRTVGGLGAVGGLSRSASGENLLKRKPSGAELSAYIGYAAQKGLGFSDPKRKVRARAVM